KIIIVNGHGGNTSSLLNAIKEYNDILEMACLLFEWWKDSELVEKVFGVPGAVHADAVETSVVWAATNLVKEDRIEGLTSAKEWGRKVGDLDLISRTEQFTATGIAGSLEGISKDKGMEVLNEAIEKLSKSITSLSQYKIE
ncbi:MAG: creatininase family protein, partial [Candidatus Heimdallarchaeaceae archaeon]